MLKSHQYASYGVKLVLAATILLVAILAMPVAQARCFGVPPEGGESVQPWYVHLEIFAGNQLEDEVEFGVGPGLSDGFEQRADEYDRPSEGQLLQAYFLYPDAPLPFSRLSKSLTGFAGEASWLLQILYSGETTDISFRWDLEDVNSIPEEIGLRMITFYEEEVDMRAVSDITFQAGPGAYNFRILAAEQEEGDFVLVLALAGYGIVAAGLIIFLRRRRR